MNESTVDQITTFLHRLGSGDRSVEEQLFEVVSDHLHRMAEHLMRGERTDHTLQATVLVNDAFLELTRGAKVTWQGRAHFSAIAARAMRRLLVNHAKRKKTEKRGGDRRRETLERAPVLHEEHVVDLLALDEAIERLAEKDALAARVFELRYFASMTAEQTALALDVSTSTVERRWAFARAWLIRDLELEEGRGQRP